MECNCIIEKLLKTPFSRRNIDEKNSLVKIWRPKPNMPDLNTNLKMKSGECTRHFNLSYYDKFVWLTGCPKLNRLFCWNCLFLVTKETVFG